MGHDLAQPAIGIDLGTTFSALACLDDQGRPRTIANRDGELATPSVVYFGRSGVVVGREALKAACFEPDAVAQYAKRDMGKLSYRRLVRGSRLPPEVIQALILRKLKDDAEFKVGEFRKAVITVPAFFNEPRRKATMDAGLLAGLEVLDIINEPTAAAIAYGIQRGFLDAQGQSQRRETILVYDLGGGTFDVTLMEIDGLSYKALATDGDVNLGGIDWNQRIADYLADQFQGEHGIDPRHDLVASQVLLQEAEDAKLALTDCERVPLQYTFGEKRSVVVLTRQILEAMTDDLLQRTIITCNCLLREAGVKWGDLTRVLLVGGSSRIPVIQQALEREAGMPVDRSLLPEEPVAMGAAFYAGFLLGGGNGRRPSMSVQNVSSHHLGVLGVERATGMPRRKILIPRNTPLPATGAGRFTTLHDDQSGVLVDVVEGGDDSGTNATRIGQCIVAGLPPGLPAGTPVHVHFAYATNGRLTVDASLPGIDHRVTMAITSASGLSDEAIRQWTQRIEEDQWFGIPGDEDVQEEEASRTKDGGM